MAERVESLMLNCAGLEADRKTWDSILTTLRNAGAVAALQPQGRVLITQIKDDSESGAEQA